MSKKIKPKQHARSKSTPPRQRRFWESPLVWVLGLIVAAGIATLILVGGGNDDDTVTGATETAFAEIQGEPLPPFASPDLAVGLEAPTVSAQTLGGERVQISADGTARLYGFFAHWCPHCREELPRTARWLDANQPPQGVEVIAVSTAVDPDGANYPPSSWFAKEEWPARVLIDDENGPLATGFGLTAFPFWVAVDANGHVVGRFTGALSDAQFESVINQLSSAS